MFSNNIRSLPPTDETYGEHRKQGHLQGVQWRAADQKGPQEVNIDKLGFHTNNGTAPSP